MLGLLVCRISWLMLEHHNSHKLLPLWIKVIIPMLLMVPCMHLPPPTKGIKAILAAMAQSMANTMVTSSIGNINLVCQS